MIDRQTSRYADAVNTANRFSASYASAAIVALPAFSAVLRPHAAAYAVQHAIDVCYPAGSGVTMGWLLRLVTGGPTSSRVLSD